MREKLEKLIYQRQDCGLVHNSKGQDFVTYNLDLAKHLIANGVTIQKWIPVTERLPIEEAKAYEQEWCEEYPEFLVMIDRGLLPTTLYYDWENNEWFRINTALKREKYKITHWMPLPQPPKGSADNG